MLSALPVCSLRMLLALDAHDPGRDAPPVTKQQVDCVLQQVSFGGTYTMYVGPSKYCTCQLSCPARDRTHTAAIVQ